MAQMWPPPKPKLAQEEFDESVKINMEDFDMNVNYYYYSKIFK
jgi:hypothetical protein